MEGNTGSACPNAARIKLRCILPTCPGFYLQVFRFDPDGNGRYYGWTELQHYMSVAITHDNRGIQAYFVCLCSREKECPLPPVHLPIPSQEILDMTDAVDEWMKHLGYEKDLPVPHIDGAATLYDQWFEIAMRLSQKLGELPS